ncbi:venom acid phosphatase Acph-1-like [Phymastichus coffea]|nr:venom acid phosphatase Acph-1-like [Phymastichus coffea]
MYPNDPYYNDPFYPVGLGGLTNKGKLREYELGEVLRRRYFDFLGGVYVPESILAQSTDYKRTKMCLQIVLSALYPPGTFQQWNNQLNWQPIPTTYWPSEEDWLLIPEECPEYIEERKKAENLPEVIEKVEKFRDFMSNLTILTGKNISGTYDFYLLYHILTAEQSMQLRLPNWTEGLFPHGKLLDGILLEYEIFSYTQKMRRLNGGKLLYSILNDIQAVKDGSIGGRKINLYSGHETNVVALLQTLGVFKYHVPQYGSAVIVELHEIDNQYYMKIIYYLGIPSTIEVLQIPGCDELCPLEQFIDLLSDVTPSSDEILCDKSNVETYTSKMTVKPKNSAQGSSTA